MWSVAKANNLLIDRKLTDVRDFPHTWTFVICRRRQIDSYMELPEDKRPPKYLWDKPEELKDFLNKVMSGKPTSTSFLVDERMVD